MVVTGGAGYIGSHACLALHRAGFQPVVVDNLVNGHRHFVRWGPLEVTDVGDSKAVSHILAKYSPVAVMNFAAYAYVGESVADPQLYYLNNVAQGLELLRAVLASGIRVFVQSSTCAVYGIPGQLPITESLEPRPINPYGSSKLFFERVLRDYEAAYGFRHVALRYFNAAGAEPGGELGELHDPETHLVPLIIQSALGQRGPVLIFGSDYATEDGTAVRDYVHVSDLAEAHVLALKYLLDGGASARLNLGTGRGYTVRQVVTAVQDATRSPVQSREAPRRQGDPPALVADPTMAKRMLGWNPSRSDISTIVGTAVEWHRRQ